MSRKTIKSVFPKEYASWQNAKQRCLNPKHKDYQNYGGRGIKVCSNWLNDFYAFIADMGSCPDGFTLDRKDPQGNYSKENCRWASVREQARNKRTNIFLEFDGKIQLLADIARTINIQSNLIMYWLRKGKTIWWVIVHYKTKEFMSLNGLRRCFRCGMIKKLCEFPRDSSFFLGHRYDCSVCHNKNAMEKYYARNVVNH